MNSFITGLLFFFALTPSSNIDNCSSYSDFHPVRSDIMMQLVLKSYGYYEGNIDGLFGSISKNALIQFQTQNNIVADGIIGSQTCNLLLNKSEIIKKVNSNISIEISDTSKTENDYSQEIYDAQLKLKELGLYTSTVDGINGPVTKRALKNFQSKSGLSPDGVLGPLTLAALEKGEDSYVTETIATNENV